MERFEIWFGGLFLGMGLIALLIAGLLYAVYGHGPRRRGNVRAFLGAPLIIGVIFTAVGGGFAGYGLWQSQVEQHVLENGAIARAHVHGPEPTLTRVNGRYLWRIRYRYQDHAQGVHESASGLMSPDEAQLWQADDVGFVRYDPNHPSTSVWLGIREDPVR